MYQIVVISARIAFIVITTIVFAIALLAYSRVRKQKLAFMAAGFGLFFVHGLLSVPELFDNTYDIGFTESWHLLIDAIAILLILIGALRD